MTDIEKLQKFLFTHLPLTSWDYEGYKEIQPVYEAQTDWNQTLITKINQTSATIFKDTLKGGANVVIISDSMKDIFKTLEYFTQEVENNYKIGILGGRFQVYCIPDLTMIKLGIPDANHQLKEVDYDISKVYVCKLKDTDKIFDIENYIRVGVITIHKNVPLFE
jgi:hypothetical protein